jgi:hypothetical protein
MEALFGIEPISNLMWSLLILGAIGSVIYGVGSWLFNKFK